MENNFSDISKLVFKAIEEKVFPGCVLGVIQKDGNKFKKEILSFGNFTYDIFSPKVVQDTIYDVASITKTVSTGFLMMKLLESGHVNLQDKLKKYLPEFQNDEATILHLLTYTLDFKNFTEKEKKDLVTSLSVEDFRNNIFNLKMESQAGKVYKYSDATADIQGRLIERVYGDNLKNLFDKYVKSYFDFQSTSLEPKDLNIENIVPSQVLVDKDLQGLVNDPKARKSYATGHFSGCAGLFSNVPDLLKVVEMFLDYGKFENKVFLKPEILKMMLKNNLNLDLPTPLCTGDNSTTSLKRIVCNERNDKAGNFNCNFLENNLFGKSGFTGCQIFGDLESGRGLVFLSNRTYPDGEKVYEKFNKFREELIKTIFV